MQKRILLADQDEAYISYLEKKFAGEFEDEADIYVITEPAYMQHVFSVQQNFDVAVVSEGMALPELGRHNIGVLFILCEEEETAKTTPNGLYKYMGVEEIFTPILRVSGLADGAEQKKETKLILLYAPSGGAGQTTLAAGICAAATRQFQRTLFAGLDSLQTSGYLLPQPSVIPPAAEQSVQSKSAYAFQAVKPFIVTGFYDMLPPFQHPLEPAGILVENIVHLIQAIKESEEYDLVVLDVSRDFSTALTKLMAEADKIILVAEQDEYSVHKLKCLLGSIDCSDNRRFALVCNRYDASEENALVGLEGVSVCEYIAKDEKLHPRNISYLAENKDISSLVQKVT